MRFKNIHFKTISSTQNWAKKHLGEIDPKTITCITADKQTKGRGRFARKWSSPLGGLYATFVFRLPTKTPHLTALGQIFSLTLANILITHKVKGCGVKWPNDIWIKGEKVAGILTELVFEKNTVAVLLGVGVNVNNKKVPKGATSLAKVSEKKWNLDILLRKLQKKWVQSLLLFQKKGFPPFQAPFEELMVLKGQEVTLFDGEKRHKGICHSLASDGSLIVIIDGEKQSFYSVDIQGLLKSPLCR